jgi:hypothetical protein
MFNPVKPYERKHVQQWSDLALDPRDYALVITAKCPECNHEVDDFILVTSQATFPLTSVLSCNCESKHDGAPEGALGCGAMSAIEIVKDASGALSVSGAGRGTLRERYWDQEATAYERAMHTRLAGIAEKWGQTAAAIFGLFGIALIVEGNDKLGELAGSKAQWPYYALAVALIVVGVATWIWRERRADRELEADVPALWLAIAGVVAGGLGFLALLPWEPFGADVAFATASAIAIALAVASTALAGFAAQGTPKRIDALTGRNMRERYGQIALSGVRNLARARWTTAWATIFLGLAVAIMWLAPQQSTAATHVRLTLTAGGGLPCGTLSATSGRRFAIDPGGGKPVEFYEFDVVERLEPVSEC